MLSLNPDYFTLAFNGLVVILCLSSVFKEIFTLASFVNKNPEARLIFVYRFLGGFYWLGFILTALVLVVLQMTDSENHIRLMPFTAILFAFMAQALFASFCFLNREGIGSVVSEHRLEFAWTEIMESRWDGNVLHLNLNRKMFSSVTLKFSDPSIIPEINESLARRDTMS